MPTPAKQIRGNDAESAAADYLQAAGLSLVMRNFRCKLGELDLIMRDRNQLVFVEVRYRSNDRFGSALESITPGKQRKVRAAAQVYLKQLGQQPSVRFDAVGISPSLDGNACSQNKAGSAGEFKIEWCQNAF